MKIIMQFIRSLFRRKPKYINIEGTGVGGKTCPECGVDGVFDGFCEECLKQVL